MPKGPRGEKRPADVVGTAVKVMKIAFLGQMLRPAASGVKGRGRENVAETVEYQTCYLRE